MGSGMCESCRQQQLTTVRISSLNESSSGGHGDGATPGWVGEAQTQMLTLEGELVRWIPCKGSGDSATISRINEVKPSHGLLLKLHSLIVSLKCFRTFAGIERQLRKDNKN